MVRRADVQEAYQHILMGRSSTVYRVDPEFVNTASLWRYRHFARPTVAAFVETSLGGVSNPSGWIIWH
jgi:hypothetical protein